VLENIFYIFASVVLDGPIEVAFARVDVTKLWFNTSAINFVPTEQYFLCQIPLDCNHEHNIVVINRPLIIVVFLLKLCDEHTLKNSCTPWSNSACRKGCVYFHLRTTAPEDVIAL